MKFAGAIVALVWALATHVEAAEIKVISTGGARAVMTSLVPEFERKSGDKVSIDFGTPEGTQKGTKRATNGTKTLFVCAFCVPLLRLLWFVPAFVGQSVQGCRGHQNFSDLVVFTSCIASPIASPSNHLRARLDPSTREERCL